jgi:hypothetical protein
LGLFSANRGTPLPLSVKFWVSGTKVFQHKKRSTWKF